ncbi:acetyl-CoA carboxylase biotin carboxylase subunit [Metabacillus sp. GX 13764]|uniref:acetyl-CoA carboxylase biotin carboxylase subunit n=1 Tax=Metabacillus kandeliae TaxID=2900151 RepID=UPI001E507B03|nr:acetyl-CoA carboxylase biotin carboxylase subunit [Metabacillus kandeliae]MCD7033905.1 acetyl-CoA carboxylase biotin carboxylase subunit [Metabacillus kandeliae]
MKKILIANRGEIALRIIKTCKEMGIETIAVYSDADKELPYVREASYAFRIGEPPVLKSYLQSEQILDLAVREGADAIHPGYGFLSENAAFCRAAREKGIVFIGPSAEVLGLMGDKVKARQTMKEAGVPVIPGSENGIDTLEEASAMAESIGYPVMLKASGGGGGIGMNLCSSEEELKKAYQSARTRAKTYFGNDEVFIEKYVANARHVEIQIFGDSHGHAVHLFERDCSVQRRNQKVIEESPSPFISDKTRQLMCAEAVKAAEFVQYENAGTIEFIVDAQENFYFLEMNTRLQVEHRVTEWITGLDLVKWQILAASGEKLPLSQDEILQSGHAIEFRLYAEDPVKFLPSPGPLKTFTYKNMDGVTIDLAYEAGNTVSPYYDPLVAKMIVHAETRELACKKAEEFIAGMEIEGIKTNLPLFAGILKDGAFLKGKYHTGYLNEFSLTV